MSKYIEMNAKIFDGFRIDNCHSTPIHVGEYFPRFGKKIQPEPICRCRAVFWFRNTRLSVC
ncbi:AFH_G0023290.mRNA.1.CDS.1 [Saccharomyces cerevisiae]|nr:AFH_G0023290.mRNA.1.CDS.1 [Saccharomyces cerevisiae]CAI6726255.1 AFH_G0023290.mRNA.1.CDS.1 [Saccharomyces cerevisiae]